MRSLAWRCSTLPRRLLATWCESPRQGNIPIAADRLIPEHPVLWTRAAAPTTSVQSACRGATMNPLRLPPPDWWRFGMTPDEMRYYEGRYYVRWPPQGTPERRPRLRPVTELDYPISPPRLSLKDRDGITRYELHMICVNIEPYASWWCPTYENPAGRRSLINSLASESECNLDRDIRCGIIRPLILGHDKFGQRDPQRCPRFESGRRLRQAHAALPRGARPRVREAVS